MNSTLTRTAAPATPARSASRGLDLVLLPVAPSALVGAVDARVAQETCAWTPLLAAPAAHAHTHAEAHADAMPFAAAAVRGIQGPPSRGTPV